MLRDDHPHSGMTQKGSEIPNLDYSGSDPLPFQPHGVELCSTRQPGCTRQPGAIRRRRT